MIEIHLAENQILLFLFIGVNLEENPYKQI
jgi:hypothetical protein